MELDRINELIDLMKERGLSELQYESGGEKVKLVLGPGPGQVQSLAYVPAPQAAIAPGEAAGPGAPASAGSAEAEAESNTVTIDSPIVGTYYRSPSPESPAFIEVGDDFDEDTVLCIVEAMKVMNEIKAERRGKIIEVLIENGQPVEFGQPLYRIEPAD